MTGPHDAMNDGPEGFIARNLEIEIEPGEDMGEATRNFINEIAEPAGFERRANVRSPLTLNVKIEILLPEQTFRPCGFDGQTMDLSVRGMKVMVKGLSELFYRRLHSKTRFARVELNDPRLGGAFKIIGKVMWFAYQSNRVPGEDGDCMLGILFDTEDRATFDRYVQFVESILAGNRVT